MTVVDQMLQSPRLPKYVEELSHLLENERARRGQFYDWLPDDKKAEFINGEVFVHSPVSFRHSKASDNLVTLLRTYVRKHDLGHVAHEKLLVCLTRNDYEPDIAYWRREIAGTFRDDQMKFPAPDLVVEVLSPSTERHDRQIKFEDYAAHGTDEYWIVDPEQRTIEQYLLAAGQYQLAVKVIDGHIRSRAIAGLQIPAQAAFDPDANLQALAAIMSG